MSVFKWLQAALCIGAQLVLATAPSARTLDGFENLQDWKLSATDQVQARLSAQPAADGKAACIAYDFGKVSGYLALSRQLPLAFDGNFALSLNVRGQGAVDSFEIKLVDASGNNVWWHRRAKFAPTPQWSTLTTKRRHIEFAWGPTTDKVLRQTDRIELVVVGAQGSKGELCFDALAITPLPEPPAQWPQALWQLQGQGDARAITAQAPWTAAAPGAGRPLVWETDFGQAREFSGLVLHWADLQHARRYRIDASMDGQDWRTIQNVVAGLGPREVNYLPEQEARYLRLVVAQGAGPTVALQGVDILDAGVLGTVNAMVAKQSSFAKRGQFPRGFSGEQAYWTILGVPGGAEQALMSEDGAVESMKGGPSVDPFVETNGRLHTWADVRVTHSLFRGYMPIPDVTWTHPQFQLVTTAFASDEAGLQTQVRYRLHNPTRQAQSMTLWLALRPFQVNPPTQFLNITGGAAPLHALGWARGVLARADGTPLVATTAPPTQLQFSQGGAGGLQALQDNGVATAAPRWEDPQGFASAAMQYRLQLPAGGSQDVVIVLPQAGKAIVPKGGMAPAAWFESARQRSAGQWASWLNRTRLDLPGEGRSLADTTRTALAHILINKEGPAIRPGTRSYARSWIRDGAMTGSVLSSLGFAQVSKEYADWFTPQLFANGKVPCCIDARGADPVPENDSMGAYLHLLADTYRHTGDLDWLRGKWPAARQVLAYQDGLRAEEGEQKNGAPERQLYRGLLPPSISHEGYSDQAAYSYWDDFWGILGYADGAAMANAVGDAPAAAHWRRQQGDFLRDVLASIERVQHKHQMAVIPGAADRGDTDPTSTTIALAPAGLQGALPDAALRATFELYWKNFTERRDSGKPWDAYTPYEWRNVGALVRLGERDRALAVADYLLRDRRPLGWQQWAEVVSRDAREPRYLGDMPHGWVSSDFLRATMDLLAYDAPERQAWVLGAGVAPAWLQGPGLSLRNLHTPRGPLSYRARRAGATTTVQIEGGMQLPAGGLVMALPGMAAPFSVRIDGQPLACLPPAGIVVRKLPAKLQVTTASDGRTLKACPT